MQWLAVISAGFKDKWCRIPVLSAGYSVSKSSQSDWAVGEAGTATKLVLSLSTRAASGSHHKPCRSGVRLGVGCSRGSSVLALAGGKRWAPRGGGSVLLSGVPEYLCSWRSWAGTLPPQWGTCPQGIRQPFLWTGMSNFQTFSTRKVSR